MIQLFKNLITKFRNFYVIRQYPGLKQLIKYLIVANAVSLFDFSAYVLLTEISSFFLKHYLITNLITMAFASLIRFFLHRQWTFRAYGGRLHLELAKFTLLTTVSIAISELVLLCSIEFLSASNIIAKLTAMAISSLIPFIGSKYWIFKQPNKPHDKQINTQLKP